MWMDDAISAVDRFERAAMAYERLGKMTRDDEKTREIRKAAMVELTASRTAVVGMLAKAGVSLTRPPE